MHRKPLPLSTLLGHAALITCGWCLFASAWWWVLSTPAATTGLESLLTVVTVALAGFPLLTHGWIQHNARHHDKRRQPREPAGGRYRRQRDWNGLLMVMNRTEARYSPWLCVNNEGRIKTISGHAPAGRHAHGGAA